MSEPLITVLVPSRREKPEYLRDCLRSIAEQTSDRWRLILIEDFEGDDPCLQVAEEYCSRLGAKMHLLGNEGRWVTGALNTGMRHASTPFVCSVHSDDMIAPHTIEELEKAITAAPTVDFFHSARIHLDDEGVPCSEVYPAAESFTLEDFRRWGPVKHLHCWRVETALAIGGMDETLGLHGADDYDFTWCMAEAGARFQPIQECLYLRRDHRSHERLTTHVPKDVQMEELRKIFRKHGLDENEIEAEIARRSRTTLREALFLDEADRAEKEQSGWDIREGYRIRYRR